MKKIQRGAVAVRLALCADNRDGLAFNGRRQSMDRRLREELLTAAGEARVWVTPYTARQFRPDQQGRLSVSERPWADAGEGDLCFLELRSPDPFWERVEELWVYRWNRDYPADVRLTLPDGWQPAERTGFAGHSHEIITKEVYRR